MFSENIIMVGTSLGEHFKQRPSSELSFMVSNEGHYKSLNTLYIKYEFPRIP